MSEHTAISWCDSTFNPWVGCTKVSPACDHCYAERLMDSRLHRVQWGAGQPRVRTSAANWRQPLLWNREAEAFELAHGRRRRVFCASLADVFDNEVPAEWRADLFEMIAATPNLDWLLLTKRIGNAHRMIDLTMDAVDRRQASGATSIVRGPWPWPNVWIGATICSQAEADRDIPKLLATPARVRFLSIEPMLGPVDLTRIELHKGPLKLAAEAPAEWRGVREVAVVMNALKGSKQLGMAPLSWVICGGESGPQARPMHPDWVRSLRDQCAAAGVPFHFKQWGEWAPSITAYPVSDSYRWPICSDQPGAMAYRVGTKAAGRLLDGIEHNGFPA